MKRLQRNPLKQTQDCKPSSEGESISTSVVKKIKLNIKPWLKIPPLDEVETEDTMKEKIQQLKKIFRIAREVTGEVTHVINISCQKENDY